MADDGMMTLEEYQEKYAKKARARPCQRRICLCFYGIISKK